MNASLPLAVIDRPILPRCEPQRDVKCRTFGRLSHSLKPPPKLRRTPVLQEGRKRENIRPSSEFIWEITVRAIGNRSTHVKKQTGKDATAAYSPKEGHSVVIYTHKFKPEHFREGVKIVTEQFPDAQSKIHQKRLNIFLRRPSTHEIVNVSFFDEGAGVHDWHESEGRLKTFNSLQGMLEKPIDVQVFEVVGAVGISEGVGS
jgi:hypothetical protein